MRFLKLRNGLFTTLVLLVFATVGIRFSIFSARAEDRIESEVLKITAQSHALSARDLEVINSSAQVFPNIQVQTTAYKILDHSSNNIYTLMLDEESNVLNPQEILKAENSAHAARYGTLDPRLADTLAAAPDKKVEVFIWLREPGHTPSRPTPGEMMSQADAQAFKAEAQSQRADSVSAVVDPVVSRMTGWG